MPRIKLLELPGNVGECRKELPQADRGADDGDVDLHGSFALQNRGEHRNAVLVEGIGTALEPHLGPRIGYHNL